MVFIVSLMIAHCVLVKGHPLYFYEDLGELLLFVRCTNIFLYRLHPWCSLILILYFFFQIKNDSALCLGIVEFLNLYLPSTMELY